MDLQRLDLQRLETASNEIRFKLLKQLTNGPGYAAKFASDFKIERKTISFHLAQLEKVKLVEHNLTLSNNRAVKEYKITTIGRRICEYISAFKN